MVGSLGVILSTFEASDLFTWMKLRPVTLKTGALKDTGNPARPWNDQDKAYLQELIDKTREQFASDVKRARGLSDIVMKHLSDGRVVLGQEAADLKLIDAIGDRDSAAALLTELSKAEPNTKVEYLEKPEDKVPRIFQYLFEESGKSFVRGGLSEMGARANEAHSESAAPKLR